MPWSRPAAVMVAAAKPLRRSDFPGAAPDSSVASRKPAAAMPMPPRKRIAPKNNKTLPSREGMGNWRMATEVTGATATEAMEAEGLEEDPEVAVSAEEGGTPARFWNGCWTTETDIIQIREHA